MHRLKFKLTPKIRLILAITLVLITILAFANYLKNNGNLITKLFNIPLHIIIEVFILYLFWFIALGLILQASLHICRLKINFKDNLLLNAYSVMANFFIPGQGGIALRGIFLKKKIKLPIKNYIYISLIYYGFYAIISIFLFLIGMQQFWITLLATLAVGFFSYFIIHFYKIKSKLQEDTITLNVKNLFLIFMTTLFQAIIQIMIYGLEINAVNQHINIWQIMSYTGAANFSLFVALTPGAIGIRESFLLLSRQIHHISEATIISASIIDRAIFIIFLGFIFIATISFRTQYNRILKKIESNEELLEETL